MRAGAASHHACGREELLRCWADSETRPQGSCSLPRAACDLEPGSHPLCKTERRDRGLDSVARDNPADSLTPQDRRCSQYPHSTGPGPTRQGVGPTRAGRRPVIASPTMLDTIHPAGCSTIHGAPPLSASQAEFGPPAGCLRPRAGPLPTAAEDLEPGGRPLGWEPLGRDTTWHGPPGRAPSGISGPPGGTGLRQPRARLGPPRASECPTISRDPRNMHGPPGIASSTSRPIGSYDSH